MKCSLHSYSVEMDERTYPPLNSMDQDLTSKYDMIIIGGGRTGGTRQNSQLSRPAGNRG
jgi:hypothetical protein